MLSNAGLPDSSYNPMVDCWSHGVILYILLSGKPPFSEDLKCGLILQAKYQHYPALYDPLSAEAKDLIGCLLKVSPEERLLAEAILRHPWLQEPAMVRRAEALMECWAARSGSGWARTGSTGKQHRGALSSTGPCCAAVTPPGRRTSLTLGLDLLT